MPKIARLSLVIICIAMAAMWVYALIFSPRESINKIYDDAWATAADERCDEARTERSELSDLSTFNVNDTVALTRRAQIVEKANESIARMINALEAIEITTDKGRALVPQWLDDYRTYLDDRVDYVALLRSGTFDRFSETQVEGVPISERIGKFAKDNEIRACIPPFDLVT
jgi:hypothetical protein